LLKSNHTKRCPTQHVRWVLDKLLVYFILFFSLIISIRKVISSELWPRISVRTSNYPRIGTHFRTWKLGKLTFAIQSQVRWKYNDLIFSLKKVRQHGRSHVSLRRRWKSEWWSKNNTKRREKLKVWGCSHPRVRMSEIRKINQKEFNANMCF
jgi:hypothetical protein